MIVETTKKSPFLSYYYTYLILNDKIIMSFNYGDQTLWPVYITIGNLNAKIQPFQKWPGILFLGFILIIHKRLKDINNENKDLKAMIYHIALKTML